MFDDFNGTVRHDHPPLRECSTTVATGKISATADSPVCHERNFASRIVNPASTPAVTINMQFEGAGLVYSTGKHFRCFRNHYLCDHCPNEWSDEMMVVGPSYCPCCDRKAEPYDTESLLDDAEAEEV